MAIIKRTGAVMLPATKVTYMVLSVVVVGMVALFYAWHRNDWDLEAAGMLGDSMAPIVGMLSLGALTVALWTARLQGLEMHRQHQVHEQQLRRERNEELKRAYAPFLTAVAAYSSAIGDYVRQVAAMGNVDENIRGKLSAPVRTAHAEAQSFVQTLILIDDDEERDGFRWKLSRGVQMEPWVDNAENQRRWRDVLLYRQSELVKGLTALRVSLKREFGIPMKEREAKTVEAEAKFHADLKTKADEAEAFVNEQLQASLKREHDAREKSKA